LRQALAAFKENCSAFLEHKDDFDVERIHEGLPDRLQKMLVDEEEASS